MSPRKPKQRDSRRLLDGGHTKSGGGPAGLKRILYSFLFSSTKAPRRGEQLISLESTWCEVLDKERSCSAEHCSRAAETQLGNRKDTEPPPPLVSFLRTISTSLPLSTTLGVQRLGLSRGFSRSTGARASTRSRGFLERRIGFGSACKCTLTHTKSCLRRHSQTHSNIQPNRHSNIHTPQRKHEDCQREEQNVRQVEVEVSLRHKHSSHRERSGSSQEGRGSLEEVEASLECSAL